MQEYILQSDGVIKRRTVEEAVVNVRPQVLQRLAKNVQLKVVNLMDHPEIGRCHLSVTPTGHLWSVVLKTINFNCPFTLKDGVMVPNFANNKEPVMNLEWAVPESIKARLAVLCALDGEQWRAQKVWLFAFASTGASYRMPLANIYEDCSVCTGDYDQWASTSVDALLRAVRQFRGSQWNQDLWYSGTQEHTVRFVRFDPKATPFKAIVPDSPWTNLCRKVANTPITEQVII